MADIRWRDKDIKKLQTYVRKFNASITRFEKQNPDYTEWQIPERLNVQELKSRIKTRADYNYQIARIDRWFKPHARELVKREGILMTKWENKEVRILQQREKANLDKIKKQYSSSPSINREAGLDQRSPDVKLREIQRNLKRNDVINNYTESEGAKSWRNFQRELERRSSEAFREAFIFKTYNAYKKGVRSIYTEEQAQAILDKLEELKVTPTELFVMRQKWDIFDNDYVYGPEEQDEKFETTMMYIDMAVNEIRNYDTYSRF